MSNGLRWQFDDRTMYTDEQARELEKTIRETGVVKDTDDKTLESFCIVLIHTRGLEITSTKVRSPLLRQLPQFLETWHDMTPEQLWDYRRKQISHDLFNQWGNDYSMESGLFATDAAELPEFALTPEQQIEANTPGSFLAESGANSPSS